jgi:chromate reductase, NAD(P)H dehydrogenase (quinone)
MAAAKILAFGGSLRAGSFNQKLVEVAARGAREAGAEVSVVALRDYRLPLFDADLEREEGMPGAARELKELFLGHEGLLVASPEYNGGMSGALKNAIDWVSRATEEGEKPLSALAGKTAALCAASPGGLGGIRGLVQLRMQLANVGMVVLPEQVTVSGAGAAFLDGGGMQDGELEGRVVGLGRRLASYLAERGG